jgi:hypothetical protein
VLKDLAERDPAAAQARVWHSEILKRQRDLLVECGERDRSVAAQLQAFPDAFGVVLAQLSASRVDPGEVTTNLGSLVARVEETERFLRALTPHVDRMLESLPRTDVAAAS